MCENEELAQIFTEQLRKDNAVGEKMLEDLRNGVTDLNVLLSRYPGSTDIVIKFYKTYLDGYRTGLNNKKKGGRD